VLLSVTPVFSAPPSLSNVRGEVAPLPPVIGPAPIPGVNPLKVAVVEVLVYVIPVNTFLPLYELVTGDVANPLVLLSTKNV